MQRKPNGSLQALGSLAEWDLWLVDLETVRGRGKKKGKWVKRFKEACKVLKTRQDRLGKRRPTGRGAYVAGGRLGEGRVFRPAHGKSGSG